MLNIWITIKFYFDVKLEIKVNFFVVLGLYCDCEVYILEC